MCYTWLLHLFTDSVLSTIFTVCVSLHNSRHCSTSSIDTVNSLSKHKKGKDCCSALQSSCCSFIFLFLYFFCLSLFFYKSKSLKRQCWVLFPSSWNNIFFSPSVFELDSEGIFLFQNSLSNKWSSKPGCLLKAAPLQFKKILNSVWQTVECLSGTFKVS